MLFQRLSKMLLLLRLNITIPMFMFLYNLPTVWMAVLHRQNDSRVAGINIRTTPDLHFQIQCLEIHMSLQYRSTRATLMTLYPLQRQLICLYTCLDELSLSCLQKTRAFTMQIRINSDLLVEHFMSQQLQFHPRCPSYHTETLSIVLSYKGHQ